MSSVVFVAAVSRLDPVRPLTAALGWGSDNLTVPLYNTNGVITHYLGRADISDRGRKVLLDARDTRALPPEWSGRDSRTVSDSLKAMMIDVRETDDPLTHALDVIAGLGLTREIPE